MFNTYYINYNKVFEIRMIIDNTLKTTRNTEDIKHNKIEQENKQELSGIIKIPKFSISTGTDRIERIKNSETLKMIETFEIKNTKSTLLAEIIEKAREFKADDPINCEIGSLIKLNDIRLDLINKDELKMAQLIKNDFLEGIKTAETDEYDLSKLSKSILKDYSYKLKGTLFLSNQESEKEFRIKIPLLFENEFENDYSIEDLLLGKVTLIGIYKGEVETKNLMSTLDYFMESGYSSNNMIKNSQKENGKEENENKKIIFIDTLAIIQNIILTECKIEGEEKRNEKGNAGLFKKFLSRIKKFFKK